MAICTHYAYHDILKHEVRIHDEGVSVLGQNGGDELRKLRARLLPELALLGIVARYPLKDDWHELSYGGSYFHIKTSVTTDNTLLWIDQGLL